MSDKDSKSQDEAEDELDRSAEEAGEDEDDEEASAEGEDEEAVDEEDDDEEDEDEEDAAQAKEPAPVRGAPPPPPPPPSPDQDPTWWLPHAVLGALVVIGVLGFFGAFNSTLGKLLQRSGTSAPAPVVADSAKAPAAPPPTATGAQPTARPRPQQPAGPVYGAKHLVVQWKGATRSKQERTKEEALKRTEEALAKLKGGAKFEDVVGEYSDEPGAKNTGGNLGKFSRQGFDPKFVDAVEKLKVGEQSGAVETAFGYHIIVRTE